MTRPQITFWLATLAAGCLLLPASAEKARPRLSIKAVMKEAIKGHSALVKKACKGTATPAELEQMVACFQDMAAGRPPRGDTASWERKCAALLEAALWVQREPASKDASYALERAVECRQCHDAHKPR